MMLSRTIDCLLYKRLNYHKINMTIQWKKKVLMRFGNVKCNFGSEIKK